MIWGKSKKKKLSKDDAELLRTVESLRRELDAVHNSLNNVTEPMLIDSCIYELKAVTMKYQYYLGIVKSKGLTMDYTGEALI